MKITLSIITIAISASVFGQDNDNALTSVKTAKETQVLIDEFDNRLKTNSENEAVGSITAAIIDGDKTLWTKSYGFVDKGRTMPVSSTTLYLIGSISKSVTGLALAKLVEQGILKLDDPIEKYLPEIRMLKNLPPNISITFRHLATHTGGLSRETDLPGASEGPLKDWEQKLIASIPMASFISESYEKYSYSNIGYGILGLAMSKATNKAFDGLIDEFVFEPLKMKSSSFVLTSKMKKRLAVAYPGTRDYESGRGYKFPNGGVYSNIEDMANFAKAQLHTDFRFFLNDSTWDQVQGFKITFKETSDEKYGYGLGVSVWTDKNKKNWIYHNGTVAPGYSASLYCDLTAKIGIIILRNDKGDDDIAGIADEFLYRLAEVKKSQ